MSEDLDNNDTGDVDLSGVTITLYDANGDVVATRLTDTEGNYVFYDLPSGDYTVIETNLPGYLDVSDVDGPNDNTINVPLGRGENVTGRDFVDELGRTISGTVLEDVDNYNTGDQPIVSAVVELFDEEGSLVNSTTTNEDGFFEFVGVCTKCFPKLKWCPVVSSKCFPEC